MNRWVIWGCSSLKQLVKLVWFAERICCIRSKDSQCKTKRKIFPLAANRRMKWENWDLVMEKKRKNVGWWDVHDVDLLWWLDVIDNTSKKRKELMATVDDGYYSWLKIDVGLNKCRIKVRCVRTQTHIYTQIYTHAHTHIYTRGISWKLGD